MEEPIEEPEEVDEEPEEVEDQEEVQEEEPEEEQVEEPVDEPEEVVEEQEAEIVTGLSGQPKHLHWVWKQYACLVQKPKIARKRHWILHFVDTWIVLHSCRIKMISFWSRLSTFCNAKWSSHWTYNANNG